VTRYYLYVAFNGVWPYLRLGWLVDGFAPGPHGARFVIMVWLCDCEVPKCLS
jgi:hypothetical protein